jgi:hypothetical protein
MAFFLGAPQERLLLHQLLAERVLLVKEAQEGARANRARGVSGVPATVDFTANSSLRKLELYWLMSHTNSFRSALIICCSVRLCLCLSMTGSQNYCYQLISLLSSC